MKKTNNSRFIVNTSISTIILLIISATIFAEEAEKQDDQVADSSLPVETYTLEDVVITASRHETLLENTPDTVQIITRQEIEEINPTSTGELFRYITGASIESGLAFPVTPLLVMGRAQAAGHRLPVTQRADTAGRIGFGGRIGWIELIQTAFDAR